MDKIIGVGWNTRNDEISNIAKTLKKCLINKISCSCYLEYHPDNGSAKKVWNEVMKAYLTGWGVLMNCIISSNVKNQ